jgi:hypothetical protein
MTNDAIENSPTLSPTIPPTQPEIITQADFNYIMHMLDNMVTKMDNMVTKMNMKFDNIDRLLMIILLFYFHGDCFIDEDFFFQPTIFFLFVPLGDYI